MYLKRNGKQTAAEAGNKCGIIVCLPDWTPGLILDDISYISPIVYSIIYHINSISPSNFFI